MSQPRDQRAKSRRATRKLHRHSILMPEEGWLAMLLLAAAVYSVVLSIMAANWVSNSYILLGSTAIGLALGLCIAKVQHFPQAILHLAACLTGHWLSIWLTSVLAFHVSWLLLLDNLRSVITGGFTASLAPGNEMVFLFYLTFLCFFLGYFGSWLIYRAHLPWLVALVYCSIMLVNLNYVGQDLSILLVTLLGALIFLVARIQLVDQLARWTQQGLHTDRAWLQNINRRYMRVTAVFALVILFVSLLLPVLGEPAPGVSFWNNLDNAWTNLTHGKLSLDSPGSLFQGYQAPANFFGDQLTITGDVNLPTGEVLYYTTTNTKAPQYLEGFTYDHFDGHTWTSVIANQNRPFAPNTLLPVDTPGSFNPVTTSVTIVTPPEGSKHYIFAPAQPSSFTVPTVIFENGVVASWTQQNPLSQGEHYQAISYVPAATPQQLSAVPLPQANSEVWSNDANYPVLQQYYLQIPNDLPPTVRRTAQQWAQQAANTYAAMRMLEAHLSDPAQFTYAVSNPPVPANVDAVAWLLQTHRGFCTYYATAMTIMARLLAVPARVVNGFNQGHFDAQRKVWEVDGNNAHSWVQVYFPGQGWINFDPTPGFSLHSPAHVQPTPMQTQPPGRPTPAATASHPKPAHPTLAPASTGTTAPSPDMIARQNLFLGFSLVTLAASLIFLLIAISTYRSHRLHASVTVATAIFWRIARLASWSGIPPQEWQTPYEYTRVLARRFPQARPALRRVADLFVRERWAAPRDMPRPSEQKDLERLWPHLRSIFLRSLLKRGR